MPAETSPETGEVIADTETLISDDLASKIKNKVQDQKSNLEKQLKERGYKNIAYKMYDGKKHDLMNEVNKYEVFKDILNFIEE